MGVNGLWPLLYPVTRTVSFSELALLEGFERNSHGVHSLIVGVDASIWMNECQSIFYHPAHAQAGKNPELRALFYRILRYLKTTATLVFVFDGPDRPAIKRGKQVVAKPHWLTEGFKDLILAAGYHVSVAPGEAEAELALLNAHDIIDAVLTEDIDTFIFGATNIIRKSYLKGNTDKVDVYNSVAIENSPDIALTRGGMFLVAVLSGGDYDEVGLTGCGVGIARKLSFSGLGDALLNVVEAFSLSDTLEYLDAWRASLRYELSNDPNGYLGCTYHQLAAQVPDTFPALGVLLQYVKPVTSWSNGGHGPDFSSWSPRQPNIERLAELCGRHFAFGNMSEIAWKFRNVLWEGACIQMLCSPFDELKALQNHIKNGVVFGGPVDRSSVLEITRAKYDDTPQRNVVSYWVKFSTAGLVAAAEAGIRGHASIKSMPGSTTLARPKIIQVPASVLTYALPELVASFRTSSAVSTRKARTRRSKPKMLAPSKPSASIISGSDIPSTHSRKVPTLSSPSSELVESKQVSVSSHCDTGTPKSPAEVIDLTLD